MLAEVGRSLARVPVDAHGIIVWTNVPTDKSGRPLECPLCGLTGNGRKPDEVLSWPKLTASHHHRADYPHRSPPALAIAAALGRLNSGGMNLLSRSDGATLHPRCSLRPFCAASPYRQGGFRADSGNVSRLWLSPGAIRTHCRPCQASSSRRLPAAPELLRHFGHLVGAERCRSGARRRGRRSRGARRLRGPAPTRSGSHAGCAAGSRRSRLRSARRPRAPGRSARSRFPSRRWRAS